MSKRVFHTRVFTGGLIFIWVAVLLLICFVLIEMIEGVK